MALTSAVANAAAAAAAAGAGKKAAQVQLQAELNNDDDWNKFIQRDGLLVVDVYTEWCGPCIGMVGNLKKIKVELGGDNLHLAVAGQLLNVVFGADAPRLTRTIEQELKNEELAKKGELERPKRAPHELTPPEQEVANAQEKIYQERKERERAATAAARAARREARALRLERHFADLCPALMMPHAQKSLRKLGETLDPFGIIVADKCPLLMTKEDAKRLSVEDPELADPATIAALSERPALTLLLKKNPDKEPEGDIIAIVRRALCGDGAEEEEPPKKSLYDDLRLDSMPGLFVPADRHQRAAALDLLFPKMVSAVADPPGVPEPPHILVLFGAWQRRAVLGAAALPHVAPRVLRYGFFATADVTAPTLLCKTVDKYEERPEKDYCETIALMLAVGLAEPELAEPGTSVPETPPPELLALGPLHVSADSVAGADDCRRFFPPGYSEPERKPRGRKGKKKKKRQGDSKDETADSTEAAPESNEAEANGEEHGEGEENGETNGESEESEEANGEDAQGVDKATSPPPVTPH